MDRCLGSMYGVICIQSLSDIRMESDPFFNSLFFVSSTVLEVPILADFEATLLLSVTSSFSVSVIDISKVDVSGEDVEGQVPLLCMWISDASVEADPAFSAFSVLLLLLLLLLLLQSVTLLFLLKK